MPCPWVSLPLGVKFQPSDEELISGYLMPMYRQVNFSSKFIRYSKDVYQKPPSDYCTNSTGFIGDEGIAKHYFCTDLNRPKGKERAFRSVGSNAYWYESQKKEIKNSNNEIIGYKKLLKFILKGEVKSLNTTTDWSMHEFSLCLNEDEKTNLVLCVIHNKKVEKGTGSCLVLDLGSGSGSVSGRLEIAQVQCCSEEDIAEAEKRSLEIAQVKSKEEIAEAERGTGGYDHHLDHNTAPQFDEEMAEAEKRSLEIAQVKSKEEIAEAERGTGGHDHHLAHNTAPQLDEEMAEAERGSVELDHHRAIPELEDDDESWIRWIENVQIEQSFLHDFTNPANENPCSAQDEETL